MNYKLNAIKPTTIEIFTISSEKMAQVIKSKQNSGGNNNKDQHNDNSVMTENDCRLFHSLAASKTLCMKITDSHGHSSNFVQLYPYGPFQKQSFELPQVSITSPDLPTNMEKQIKTNEPNKPSMTHIPAFGILCSLLSVLCFSFNSVIVRLLKSNYAISGIQVLVTRALFQLIICGLTVLLKGQSFKGTQGAGINLVGRAVTGTISLSCLFTAFNLMPIGDATTIYFSSPVLVSIFAYFLLGEPFRLLQLFTCVFTMAGVGLITKPEFIFGPQTDIHYPHQLLGKTLVLVAVVSSSLMLINLRKLKNTSPAVVVFWFASSVVFFGSVAMYVLGTFQPVPLMDPLCTGLLTIIGLLSICEQYFLAAALKYEDATTISVTRSFNIVLAFLWEVVIFKELMSWTSLLGATVVCTCILLLALWKSIPKLMQYASKALRLSNRLSIDIEKSCVSLSGGTNTISATQNSLR